MCVCERERERERGRGRGRERERERERESSTPTDTESAKNTLIRLGIIGAGHHARATRAVAIRRTPAACSSCSPLPQVSPCVEVQVQSVAFTCEGGECEKGQVADLSLLMSICLLLVCLPQLAHGASRDTPQEVRNQIQV